MSEKLLPCPFCGGEADCNKTGCMDYELHPLWWVECLGCGIATSGCKEKEESVAAWNRRAEPDNVPTCFSPAEGHEVGRCYGMAQDEDDEPIDRCKQCPYCTTNNRRAEPVAGNPATETKPIEIEGFKIEAITIDQAANAISIICNGNGCPPDVDCYNGQNCHECYKRFVRDAFKPIEIDQFKNAADLFGAKVCTNATCPYCSDEPCAAASGCAGYADGNVPLTLDELRGMDGELVWIETGEVSIDEQIVGRRAIIHSVSNTHMAFMGGGNGLHLDNYGKTWLAYRCKPEEV